MRFQHAAISLAFGLCVGFAEPGQRPSDASSTVIPFVLERPGNVSAAVYDSSGRLVRELLHAVPKVAGKHAMFWDGLDRDGNTLPAGNYTWKLLQTPGLKATYLM